MVARRDWTRYWWDECAADFELVTSQAVIDELEDGQYDARAAAVNLIAGLPRLDSMVGDVSSIVEAYLANHLMPDKRRGDALHLALASYHKCDYLLTWNCAHIANGNKFGHIRVINTRLGLFIPTLLTPEQLSEED